MKIDGSCSSLDEIREKANQLIDILNEAQQKIDSLTETIIKSESIDWSTEIVGRMHESGVTGLQLAKEVGITNSYLSKVIHGEKGNEKTPQRINYALEHLEIKQNKTP